MDTVLISGASGGLGTSVTLAFLGAGWRVHAICSSKASAHALREALQKILQQELSSNLFTFIGNVAERADAERFAADASNVGSSKPETSIRAIVCLAGGIRAGKRVEETDTETLDAMLNANLKTAFNLTAAALPLLKKNDSNNNNRTGGTVITIGAGAALHAETHKSAYAASKAAVIALTQTIAAEGRTHKIRANCIVPSIINTAANRAWGTPEEIATWTLPEDIAAMILHLCSDSSKAVTGAVIPM